MVLCSNLLSHGVVVGIGCDPLCVDLHPAALVISLISSRSFFVDSLGFSTENRDVFTSSFPICIPFIFLA